MDHLLVVNREHVVDIWDLPAYGNEDEEVSIISDEIIGTSRWSIQHKLIVQIKSRFYQTTYSKGATENQEQEPWEYDATVAFREVEKVQKLVDVWQVVAIKEEA